MRSASMERNTHKSLPSPPDSLADFKAAHDSGGGAFGEVSLAHMQEMEARLLQTFTSRLEQLHTYVDSKVSRAELELQLEALDIQMRSLANTEPVQQRAFEELAPKSNARSELHSNEAAVVQSSLEEDVKKLLQAFPEEKQSVRELQARVQLLSENIIDKTQKYEEVEARVNAQLQSLKDQEPRSAKLEDQEFRSAKLEDEAEPKNHALAAHPKFSLWRHVRQHFLHQHFSEDLEYTWSETLWDAALFVGTEQLSIAASMVVVLCFFLYLIVLTTFLEECGQTLIAPFLDQQAELEFNFWRTTVAHDPLVRNVITGESLARSVCDQRMYTPFANLQFSTFAELKEYLKERPLYGGPQVTAGVLMCTLSLTVWYLTLSIEVRTILDQLSAILFIPRERRTRFEQDLDDPSKVHLVSFSSFRYVLLIFLGLTRSVVVGFLAVYGSLFLVHEINLEDMMMNSVALELILNLDELFFCALLPKVAQSLFSRVQPVGYRHQRVHWNTYGYFIGAVLVITSAYLTIWTYSLAPYRDRLQASSDALCGGVESSLDFVQVADRIGIPWVAKTDNSIRISETYAQQVVKSVKQDGFPQLELTVGQRNNSGVFMQVASADALDLMKSNLPEFKSPFDWEMAHPTEYGTVVGWTGEVYVLADRDFGDEPGTVYNNYLEFLLQKKGVTCNDVPLDRCVKHGSQLQDIVMRKLCPNRCGCPLVHEGSVSNAYSKRPQYGFAGCSIKDTRKKPFVDALAALPCTNSATSDSFWTWVQGVGDARSGTGGSLKDELVTAFTSGGCDAVASYDLGTGKFCAETSLTAICPESCGCNASIPWTPHHSRHLEYCPYSCGRQEPVCLTIKAPSHNQSYASGPLVGFPCVFPFQYKGVTYHSCTGVDWSWPWCAISVHKDGNLVYWGDCSDTCYHNDDHDDNQSGDHEDHKSDRSGLHDGSTPTMTMTTSTTTTATANTTMSTTRTSTTTTATANTTMSTTAQKTTIMDTTMMMTTTMTA